MAGPAASVWFCTSHIDARARLHKARARCGEVAGSDEDFRLQGRPFVAKVGPEYPSAMQAMWDTGLPDWLNWSPDETISLAAMCNAAEDHRLLALLCVALCEETDGIVDFGGELLLGTDLPFTAATRIARYENPRGLTGTLFVTSYEIEPGRFGTRHFGDAPLLRAWLAAPDFRMPK